MRQDVFGKLHFQMDQEESYAQQFVKYYSLILFLGTPILAFFLGKGFCICISIYLIIPILAYTSGANSIVLRCAIVLFIIGIIKHRINIQRIINGTETGLRSVLNKNKTK